MIIKLRKIPQDLRITIESTDHDTSVYFRYDGSSALCPPASSHDVRLALVRMSDTASLSAICIHDPRPSTDTAPSDVEMIPSLCLQHSTRPRSLALIGVLLLLWLEKLVLELKEGNGVNFYVICDLLVHGNHRQ